MKVRLGLYGNFQEICSWDWNISLACLPRQHGARMRKWESGFTPFFYSNPDPELEMIHEFTYGEYITRWWFEKNMFIPVWGNDPIWREYFSNGWFNHQLVHQNRRVPFFSRKMMAHTAIRPPVLKGCAKCKISLPFLGDLFLGVGCVDLFRKEAVFWVSPQLLFVLKQVEPSLPECNKSWVQWSFCGFQLATFRVNNGSSELWD